jgi:tetratricopeptide (TPR) repeat protein
LRLFHILLGCSVAWQVATPVAHGTATTEIGSYGAYQIGQRVSTSEFYQHAQASSLLETHHFQKAIPVISKAIEMNPGSILGYLQLGIAYSELATQAQASHDPLFSGYLQQSRECFEQVLELNDELMMVYFKLGKIALLQNDPVAAQRYYKAGLNVEPDNAVLLFNLGRVHDQLHQNAEAIACYQKAVRLSPGFVYAHNNLGLMYETQGQYKEAEASYEAALSHQQSYTMARVNLANLYTTTGQYAKAEQQFDIALKQDAADEWTHYYQGMLYFRMGQYQKTVAAYQRCLAVNPRQANAYYMLTVAYTRLNLMDEAIQASLHYLEESPEGEHAEEMKRFVLGTKLAHHKIQNSALFLLNKPAQ